MSYVCRTRIFVTEESNISKPSRSPKAIQILSIAWFAVTVIALVLILKPYNKAYNNGDHSVYAFNLESSPDKGYGVDYNGVVDLVSYANGLCQAEVVIKRSKTYRFSIRSKVQGDNLFSISVNGIKHHDLEVGSNREFVKIDLRKNDKLRWLLVSQNNTHNEVEIKIDTDNSKQQRRVYGIILLYLVIGVWLLRTTAGIHIILPSAVFLLAIYNEHLYPVNTWILPMWGFIACFALLSIIRFFLSKVPYICRLLMLVLDYFLIGIACFLSVFVWNYKRYGYKMDFDTIVAILQSNKTESLEFLTSELNILIVVALLLVLVIPVLLLRFGKGIYSKPVIPYHLFVLIISMTMTYVGLGDSGFIQEFRSAHAQYYEEIAKFNEVQQQFANPDNIEATKDGKGETYIIIIGESQSKEHMSVYGYHRNTTPFLDSLHTAGKLALFTDAYSSHTHTIMVLQHALTQANQYNGLDFTQVPSLMNVLNAADFETVWLSNQVKLSNWDNIVSAIAAGCQKQIFVNKNIGEAVVNSPYDQRLLPELEKLLQEKTNKNRVVFMHLLGNHGRYQERYPPNFRKLASKGVADFGQQPDLAKWEAYDNSIRYNDSILSEVFDLVHTYTEGPSAITYFADHGEDLSENRGHNAGQFTYRMTQIPMFVWANKAYRQTYTSQWESLASNCAKRFSNDLFFQFALGLTQIKTPLYNAQYDVSQPTYYVDTFKTKGGRLIYEADDNPYTSFKMNLDTIRSWKMGDRIGFHRVNTFGKANEIIIQDGNVVEIDVKFVGGKLMVGHGEDAAMTGVTLATYLNGIALEKLKKCWLEIKNLDDDNFTLVFSELIRLDSIYQLKEKMIVETRYHGVKLSRLRQSGFSTCYYITNDDLRNTSGLIAQLRKQQVAAISFESVLYDQIKQSVAPFIAPSIDFHTWNIAMDARHGKMLEKLKSETYFGDTRVKTILVSYPSVFDL